MSQRDLDRMERAARKLAHLGAEVARSVNPSSQELSRRNAVRHLDNVERGLLAGATLGVSELVRAIRRR